MKTIGLRIPKDKKVEVKGEKAKDKKANEKSE